jgi:hypothetical protein
MMKSRTMNRACMAPAGIAPRSIALGLCLLALSNIATTTARAEDDDSGLFGTMMRSFGLSDKKIEYRDRPALQVPQTRDLPPPGSAAAPARTGAPVARSDRMSDLDKLATPQRAADPTGGDTTGSVPPPDSSSSPGFFGKLFSSGSSQQQPVAPIAPTRNTLLQPPPDYESPSPAAPYGSDGKASLGKRSASDKPISSGAGQ